jgi:beta-lactamase regulating signal transducer with metallopeptidase domain
MFYLLCFCVVFAVIFLAFAVTTLASLPMLRLMAAISSQLRAATAADLLFTVRGLPLLAALVIGVGLALPAFLEFEPHSTHENPGPALLLLGVFGLLITIAVLFRLVRTLRFTLALERRWLANATAMRITFQGIPVFRVNDSGSLVAVVGIFKPRIFVSKTVADLLNEDELEAAFAHELAHVRARDNLRHLLLNLTAVPGLSQIALADSVWASASELAADERAIAQGASAVDLSSALVKVGRLSFERPPALLAASHLVDNCHSATLMRAARLRDLLNGGTLPIAGQTAMHRGLRWILYGGSCLAIYLLALASFLPSLHEALEFFVRY